MSGNSGDLKAWKYAELLLILSIIPKFFNFECHNFSFLDGYIPPESSTKLRDISRW